MIATLEVLDAVVDGGEQRSPPLGGARRVPASEPCFTSRMAPSLFTVPLPRAWPRHARSAALQALALAHFVATHVRGWCLESRITRVRLAAERDIALSKVAVLQEEARILRARVEHLCPQRRSHYPPPARLAILVLRAACGWTVAETARRFQISPQTIANWMQRLDEHGESALVRMPEPGFQTSCARS